MNKYTLLLFGLIILFACSKPNQKEETSNVETIKKKPTNTVIPGVGTETVVIGANINNVLSKLGQPERIYSRLIDIELTKKTSSIKDTLERFIYHFDFDSIYYFNENKYGIYKVCTKDNIITIICHSYIALDSKIGYNNFPRINDAVGFFDNSKSIEAFIGENGIKRREKIDTLILQVDPNASRDDNYYYFDKGINLYLTDDKLNGFEIYQSIPLKVSSRIEKYLH
jgi:hypothetical protein